MPHPQEGKRIKRANSDLIYLILDGERRHIPSWEAYTRLFENNNWAEWDVSELEKIPLGREFDANVALVAGRRTEGRKVFLRDGSTYRWIRNPDAMRRYDFSFERVKWDSVAEDFTANGPDITEQ